MNLILITVDALREDYFDHLFKGNGLLKKIRNESTDTEMISNSCWTPPSFKSLLSSTYPLDGDGYPELPDQTLQKTLKDGEYKTAVFHSTPHFSEKNNYSNGFDVFKDTRGRTKRGIKSFIKEKTGMSGKLYNFLEEVYKNLIKRKETMAYSRASTITKEIMNWVENREEDFFVWGHYMDCHAPFHPPEEIVNIDDVKELNRLYFDRGNDKNVNIEERIEDIKELYKGEVKYVGLWLEYLLQKLKDKEILDETCLIITSDHGEEFLEHGRISHKPRLYDELIRVPLMIYSPKKEIKVEGMPQGIDVPATALGLLNKNLPDSFKGRDLTQENTRKYTISEVSNKPNSLNIDPDELQISYRTEKYKYIWKKSSSNELYNLTKDPEEKDNVIDSSPETERFLSKVEKRVSEINVTKSKTSVEKNVKQRLEKLGYK